MQRPTIAILGASGYTGVELTRLVAQHPGIELRVAGSDRWAGDAVATRAGIASAVTYSSPDRAEALARECAAVLLATPAEVSHELVPRLADGSRVVIDLSGAFRLRDAAAYPVHYKFEHRHPELLARAVYAVPELARERVRAAKLISNPGCYATAIQLALAPLLPHVEGPLVVDAVSGVTGAGRKATEDMSFAEIAGDVRAYRTLQHQHAPEIAQALGAPVVFVPHLVPIARGILATCHAQLRSSAAEVAAAYERAYGGEPFITLARGADAVAIHDVVGTNRCKLGWTIAGDRIVAIAAIDNLVKGAAGQAVQNLNLALGLPETSGLELRGFHP